MKTIKSQYVYDRLLVASERAIELLQKAHEEFTAGLRDEKDCRICVDFQSTGDGVFAVVGQMADYGIVPVTLFTKQQARTFARTIAKVADRLPDARRKTRRKKRGSAASTA